MPATYSFIAARLRPPLYVRTSPSAKNFSVGYPWMPKRWAVFLWAVASSFAITTPESACSSFIAVASSAQGSASDLQWPHHGA